jgi:hypothetical protein
MKFTQLVVVAFAAALTVATRPASCAPAPVIEFYNAALDQFHSTLDVAEIHDLDTGVHPGWTRTGQRFVAYDPKFDPANKGMIVRRWYGKPSHGLNSHFLTWLQSEMDALETGFLAGAWILEGLDTFQIETPTMAGVCPAATVPVYRLWNNRPDSGHRYTADKATQQSMVAAGYVVEGFGPDAVFMCAVAPLGP